VADARGIEASALPSLFIWLNNQRPFDLRTQQLFRNLGSLLSSDQCETRQSI
jgi:hypothetical protein